MCEINLNNNQEMLLQEDDREYVIYPIRYEDMWNMYKKQLANFWTVEEIDLGRDRVDWDNLKEEEKNFIKMILAFFAGSDGIVMENLGTRFAQEVKVLEAQYFYNFQIPMEGIHAETYALLLDTYITNNEEKNNLFNAINTIPCVQKKALWAIKWIQDKETNFAVRLIAFAVVEGIFFSGSFCAIFWLKKRGLMPGLTFSNELISRDEGLHTDFAVLLYSYIKNRIPKEIVFELFKEAVEIESDFICDALQCSLIGMNATLMKEYIKFVADRLLVQLKYPKLYNAKNPFDFMEMISLEGKGNFFEKRVSEYAKAGVGKTKEDMSFGLDADF